MRFFVTGLFFILSWMAQAQSYESAVIKDLREDWKAYSNNQYKEYSTSEYKSIIYFLVDANKYKDALLRIESKKEFSILLDGRLIVANKMGVIRCDLDSLSALYSNPLNFSIIRSAVDISTKLIPKQESPLKEANLVKRKEQYFLNFSIMASLILLTFFVVLLRTNPKLTFDYLNFTKLFSVQEREENIMTIRITSSVNLLFYTFTSLLASFLLLIIFHYAYADLSLDNLFHVNSVRDGFTQWMKLTAIVLLTLIGKLILIGVLSYLFKATEMMAMQFFNFIRLFFFTFGVISLLVALFFMANVHNPAWYYGLCYVLVGIFIFWDIILFLKLMSRVPFHIFHLFLYLCASELIPLVILIKVVFY